MSVLLRGTLVLLAIFIFIATITYQSLSKKSTVKRAYTYLLLSSTLFPFLDLGISAGGLNLKVFNVVTIAYTLFNIKPLLKVAKQYYLILIYIAILLFTSLMSDFKWDSICSIPDKLKGAIIFLAAMIVFNNLDERNRLALYAKYLKTPIYIAIFFGLVQIFIDMRFSLFYSVWEKEVRISSCFIDPQSAGCCISMFAVYIWNKYLNTRKHTLLFTLILLITIGLNTGSKVFILGTILGILASFIFTKNKTIFSILIIIVGSLLFITQDYWGKLLFFERLQDVEASMDYRQEIFWLAALDIFYNNWFSGIGSGVFRNYIEKHDLPFTHFVNGEEIFANQPESGYLLWLDELGIFSAIYIIIILYFVIKRNGNSSINLSIIVPWFIAFISLYNFSSNMLVYILFLTLALITQQSNCYKKIIIK